MTERQLPLLENGGRREMIEVYQVMQGFIMPDDVAALALFLATNDSAMCSGQEFTVDGGANLPKR